MRISSRVRIFSYMIGIVLLKVFVQLLHFHQNVQKDLVVNYQDQMGQYVPLKIDSRNDKSSMADMITFFSIKDPVCIVSQIWT